MNAKTIKVRFSNGVLEPLNKVDIPEGKVLIISIIGEPNKSDKKKFVEGINASFEGWKDLVDCDELKKNIYNDRLISTRPEFKLEHMP
ncbi:antitoxin family protein [bacterium]|nr:antitoxin family protein [bacterium]